MSLNPVERPHETTFSSPLTSTPTFAPDFPQTPLHASRRRVDPRRAISQSAEQKRGQRRESYMNKVKEQREEGRWDARGDQILYADYISERKAWEQWEHEQACAVPTLEDEAMDEQVDEDVRWRSSPQQLAMGRSATGQDMAAARLGQEDIDEILEAEARELEALVALHEQAPEEARRESEQQITRNMPHLTHQQSSPYLGPDDGDFDELLLDEGAMDIS